MLHALEALTLFVSLMDENGRGSLLQSQSYESLLQFWIIDNFRAGTYGEGGRTFCSSYHNLRSQRVADLNKHGTPRFKLL